MNIDKLNEYSVEQLIDYISNNHITRDKISNKIDNSSLSDQDKEELLKKINRAYGRINEPLELSLKIYYFFVPFGITYILSKSEDVNLQRFEKYQYLRKIKSYYRVSIIGFITYILAGATAGLIARYT